MRENRYLWEDIVGPCPHQRLRFMNGLLEVMKRSWRLELTLVLLHGTKSIHCTDLYKLCFVIIADS